MELKIDDRERAVIPHFETSPLWTTEVMRLGYADYAALFEGKLLALIERKTWSDLSASIKDKRASNIEHVVRLCASHSARVYYVVEGETPRNENTLIGGIPFKNLRSYIFHMCQRHSVMVWYTPNEIGTAKQIEQYLSSMYTLMNKKGDTYAALVSAAPSMVETQLISEEAPPIIETCSGSAEEEPLIEFEQAPPLPPITEIIRRAPTKDKNETVLNALPGIGKTTINNLKHYRAQQSLPGIPTVIELMALSVPPKINKQMPKAEADYWRAVRTVQKAMGKK